VPNGHFTPRGRALAWTAHTCPAGQLGCYGIERNHGGKAADRRASIRRFPSTRHNEMPVAGARRPRKRMTAVFRNRSRSVVGAMSGRSRNQASTSRDGLQAGIGGARLNRRLSPLGESTSWKKKWGAPGARPTSQGGYTMYHWCTTAAAMLCHRAAGAATRRYPQTCGAAALTSNRSWRRRCRT
jgi:hypothetical protein